MFCPQCVQLNLESYVLLVSKEKITNEVSINVFNKNGEEIIIDPSMCKYNYICSQQHQFTKDCCGLWLKNGIEIADDEKENYTEVIENTQKLQNIDNAFSIEPNQLANCEIIKIYLRQIALYSSKEWLNIASKAKKVMAKTFISKCQDIISGKSSTLPDIDAFLIDMNNCK
jgi:hypothetical protein